MRYKKLSCSTVGLILVGSIVAFPGPGEFEISRSTIDGGGSIRNSNVARGATRMNDLGHGFEKQNGET